MHQKALSGDNAAGHRRVSLIFLHNYGVGTARAVRIFKRYAILHDMKVEEIAEAVAKLPPDQASAGGSPHSRRAAATTSSTPLRLNLVASPAVRLLN